MFKDLGELEAWLTSNGIDTSDWGVGGNKSVANLWNEIVNDDIQIQRSPPLRVVHVVGIIMRRDTRILKELEQEFGNGERRFRSRLPSEKMKIGETCIMAALRCLEEELGVSDQAVTFTNHPCEQVQNLTGAASYPGLPTQYTFHTIEVTVNSLPDTDFWTENTAFEHGDPVRRQRWGWVSETHN